MTIGSQNISDLYVHTTKSVLERAKTYWNKKLSLRLTKHHATKVYWGSESIAPLIL